MEAALDLESSAFGLGGSTPLAPTKDMPARRNGKTRCIQNAVSSDAGGSMPSAGTKVIEYGELAEWSKAPHC
jgi:hypothetical protein